MRGCLGKILIFEGAVPLLFLIGILIWTPNSSAKMISANIPLNSWIYSALDKLSGLGLVESALQGSRPFSRMEAARQTLEASKTLDRRSAPPVARELIRKLEVELHQQLVELGAQDGIAAETYFKPLGDWQISYINKDGKDSLYAIHGTEVPGSRIDAHQYSLNYNNFGIDYKKGGNAQLNFESEARLGENFLLNVQPILQYSSDLLSGANNSNLKLLQGSLAVGFGPIELSLGRQALWWGQGRHGSLVLTNNADPLDMLRLTNPNPVLFPWVFESLGPFRFDLFLSKLENDRFVSDPFFGGLRIEFKPLPWLEFGACRTVIFGGEGRPKVGFSDFMTIIAGQNLSGTEDTSNQIAALDARIKIPILWGMELYGEMGGEDQKNKAILGVLPFISNKAYVAGIYLPKLEPSGRASLRLEYAELNHFGSVFGGWYRHNIYQSGYTYKNKVMGHHAGPMAEDIFTEFEVLLPNDLSLTLGYDYEKRGYDQPVREFHRQPMVSLRWDFSPRISLNARCKYDSIKNYGFVSGRDEDFYMTEFAVGGRF